MASSPSDNLRDRAEALMVELRAARGHEQVVRVMNELRHIAQLALTDAASIIERHADDLGKSGRTDEANVAYSHAAQIKKLRDEWPTTPF